MSRAGIVRLSVVLCLLSALAGTGRAADGWGAQCDALLQQPGQGPEVIKRLLALAVDERKTSDYHWLLARACQSAGKAGQTAEALATFSILPAQPARDVTALRRWLTEKSSDAYRQAMEAQRKGDKKTSLKAFLLAVKCDASVLGRDTSGLSGETLQALEHVVQKHPEIVDYQFQLALIAYLMGQPDISQKSLETLVLAEKDAYKLWRANLWLARLKLEAGHPDPAASRAGSGLELFRTRVRSLLIERCLGCHGGGRTKGGFDLRTQEALLQGGKSGVAVVLKDSASSPMMGLVQGTARPAMPPKRPLSPEEIRDLATWIDQGAPYDGPLTSR